MTVIKFPAASGKPSHECECGEQWIDTAVYFGPDGKVAAVRVVGTCSSCGKAVQVPAPKETT